MTFTLRSVNLPKEVHLIIKDKDSDKIEMSVLKKFGGGEDFSIAYMCMLHGIHISAGEVPEIPTKEEKWTQLHEDMIEGGVRYDFGKAVPNQLIENVADRILRSFIKKNGLIESDNIKKKNEMYNLLDSVLINYENYWGLILMPFYLKKVIIKDKAGFSFVSRLAASRTLNVDNKTMEEIKEDMEINEKTLKGKSLSMIERISNDFINKQNKFHEDTKLENIIRSLN